MAALEEFAPAASRGGWDCEHLVGMLAHDLRAPIGGLIGFLECLESTSLDSEQREMLGTCLLCARDTGWMLDGLLEIVRNRAIGNHLSVADPREFLAPTLAWMGEMSVAAGLVFHVDLAGEFPLLEFDTLKLRQIVQNLCVNALKFTPSPGEVRMSLIWKPSRWDRSGILHLTVRDTGPGMSAQELETVFGIFSQGSKKHSAGAGLGLAIVCELVRAAGGTLRVNSVPRAGTQITVVIPAQQAASIRYAPH